MFCLIPVSRQAIYRLFTSAFLTKWRTQVTFISLYMKHHMWRNWNRPIKINSLPKLIGVSFLEPAALMRFFPRRWQSWVRQCGYGSSGFSCACSSAGLQPAVSARWTRCLKRTSSGSCTASWSNSVSPVPGWSIRRIRPPTSSDLRAYKVRSVGLRVK